jgi:PAS domain S-box-containing protein
MDQKVVECNPAFEELFGYSLREVVGRDLDHLILPEALLAEGKGFTRRVIQGNPVHALTHRKNKFGELIEVELFGVPLITRERQIGILALYHDVRGLVQSTPAPIDERAIVPTPTHVNVHTWGTTMLEDN